MQLDVSLVKKFVSIETFNIIAHNKAKNVVENFKYDVMLYKGKKGTRYVILKGYIFTGDKKTRIAVVKSLGNLEDVLKKYHVYDIKKLSPLYKDEMEVRAYNKVLQSLNK